MQTNVKPMSVVSFSGTITPSVTSILARTLGHLATNCGVIITWPVKETSSK